MEKVTKKQFISSAVWKIVESFSSKGVALIVTLVLARILSPADYGIISLTAVFTSLSDIFIQGGFNTALVQKKDVDDADYSAVLYLSVSISMVLYAALFISAPYIAAYYEEPVLTGVLRVIGLVLFCQAFSSVRTAIVTRKMQFRLLFVSNLFGTLVSAVVGIAMAYMGYGVWALVGQQLSQQILVNAFLYWKIKWKPVRLHSLGRIRSMFSFSVFVLLSSLLSYFGDSIYSLIVGKVYSVEELGYYTKGDQLPRQMALYTFGAITSVLLPTFASYQTDLERLKAVVRKVISITAYIIFPCMAGMLIVAEPLTVLLLTEKWLGSVPVMMSACIYYAATPIMLICVQIFLALGRSQIRVWTEVTRLVLMLAALGITVWGIGGNIYMLAWGRTVIQVGIAIVTLLIVRKKIGYTIREILMDMGAPFIYSGIMILVLYFTGKIQLPLIGTLCVQAAIGAAVYMGLSVAFRNRQFKEIMSSVKLFKRK